MHDSSTVRPIAYTLQYVSMHLTSTIFFRQEADKAEKVKQEAAEQAKSYPARLADKKKKADNLRRQIDDLTAQLKDQQLDIEYASLLHLQRCGKTSAFAKDELPYLIIADD